MPAQFTGPGIDPNASGISGQRPFDPRFYNPYGYGPGAWSPDVGTSQDRQFLSNTYQGTDQQRSALKRGNLQELQRTAAIARQFPGYVPGSEYQVNFGLGARDPNSIGMGAFQQGMGGYSDVMGRSGSLADMLSLASQGQGPSAAQNQFQSSLDQSIKAAQALGQSMPGGVPGGQLRDILAQQGNLAAGATSAAGALRANEMMGARSQLGQLLGQMGSQGLGVAQLGAGMSEQDRQALLDLERQRLGALGTQVASDTAVKGQESGLVGKIAGGLIGGAGAAGAAGLGGAKGGRVVRAGKGQHAEVAGDSEQNDKVPIMATEGEGILPRSVMQSEDAPEKARDFVAAIKGHYKKAKGGEVGPHYGAVLAKLRNIEQRLSALGG